MRIVGGRFKGRRLAEPRNNEIRPTTDRNRESLFNILSHGFADKLNATRVLDVFAGTGALGLEALSRGARFGVFIEQSAQGRGLLRNNIEDLGLTGETKIFRRDATRPGSIGTIGPFNLVFADPPYRKQLGQQAALALAREGWLADDSLLVLEESEGYLPDRLEGFERVDERRFGATAIGLFVYQGR